MVDGPAPPPRPSLDVNTVYAPATAPIDFTPPLDPETASVHRGARRSLLIVAFVSLASKIVALLLLGYTPPPLDLVINFTNVAVLTGCWLWARVDPYPAAITALLWHIAYQIGLAVYYPGTLTRGIVIKLVLLYMLVTTVRDLQRLRDAPGIRPR